MIRRRTLLRVACAALASLAALEIGLRVTARATHRERGLTFDRELGWRQRANLVKVGRYWSASEPARTNSRGWRDVERAFEKPPGMRRIVAVGDSFTFGAMVDREQRFTEQLEHALPRVEVINLGVSAYGPDQELRLLETEGLRYAPDVVLAQLYFGNDLDDVRYERHFAWPKPHYELESGRLRFVPAVATWDVWLREWSYVGELGFKLVDGGLVDRHRRASAWESADTVPLVAALLAEMDRLARERGARLLVLIASDEGRVRRPPDPREVRAREAITGAGIAVLDPLEPFAERTRRGDALFAIPDGHWNAAGHALAAEVVRTDLARLGWLP